MNIKQQRKTEYGCDETIQDMKILFRLANAAFGTEWITKQQIYSLVDQEEDLFSWMNLNERRGQTMIGKALSHYNEQVLGGIMLKTVGGKNIRRYRFSKANVMSGITTSETMSGEQPKNEDLGSRVDELIKKVEKQRDALNAFQKYALESIEALEKKINDGR